MSSPLDERMRPPLRARDDAPSPRRWPWPWPRVNAPRRLKFTREGKFFVGITLGVGFAAVNTGNNLLYLLLGMLLALIIVSGLMSELSLRDLTVVRRLPTRAQVGRPHLVEIEVFNHKKRVPSYAIEVEDLRAGQPADKRCFFLKISPKSAQVAAYRRTPGRRGRDTHVAFRLATRFPFGLFEKSREVAAKGELIIYPAVDAVNLPVHGPGRLTGGDSSYGRGNGDDYLGMRFLRDGEDRRDIHWRKSAAVGQLVMRERARDARPDVLLAIDVVRPEGGGDDWTTAFERRIRDVASRSVAHIKRGDAVAIRTTGAETVRGDQTTGADPLLRFLALLDEVPAGAVDGTEPAPSPARRPPDPVPAPPSSAAAFALPPTSSPHLSSPETSSDGSETTPKSAARPSGVSPSSRPSAPEPPPSREEPA
jgi:uncharacterized protein (DUF58 family)